ncbi:MAG: queuosine precursor transporter [Candidatus Heimdallarchaeota archaeon]|nr:MAG: queuosine precursor transporter [Candidatus Heimdallarchaeota archaeon]
MLEGLIVGIAILIILGVLTYLGAWFTAKSNSPHALISIYILFLTLAQFFAVKAPAVFDLGLEYIPILGSILVDIGLLPLLAPAGVIVFPFTLQVTDMVNEKFGRQTVYEMIWIALISQIIMVILLFIAGYIPVPEWGTDPLTEFLPVPTITLASWIAFLISERFDAWLYDRVRTWIQTKYETGKDWWKYLWIRNVFSDVLSLAIDSIIFVPLAFYGFPLIFGLSPDPIDLIITMIFGQIITKWFLGLIDTPYMYLTRWIYDREAEK